MSYTKKILLGFALLITAAVLILFAFLKTKAPQYSGTKSLQGIEDEVDIFFDDYGIPHISAQNEPDAFFALGYTHASERLFQMELLRRLSQGGLAEILGREFLPVDELFLTLGIEEHARRSARVYREERPDSYDAMESYIEGINAYIDRGPRPLEFHLMGIPKRAFSMEDCFSITGYMAFTFVPALKTDPPVTYILDNYGEQYLKPWSMNWPEGKLRIPVHTDSSRAKASTELEQALGSILEKVPVGLFHGSNGIVLDGSRTKSGKPILVNDTHIKFSQPATWYESHLSYPGQNIYGNFIAGFPFPIIGHNEHHAWGMTMLQTDDMDFFVEEYNPRNPLQVRYDNAWETMDTLHYDIAVKDADSASLTVRKTRHGPLVNDVVKEIPAITARPVSVQWGYTDQLARNPEATYKMATSKSMSEMRKAVSLIHSPPINLMYADVENNIAWWSMARIARKQTHVNSKTFLDGTNSSDEIVRYLDFNENPHSENPPSGVIITANNQPKSHLGMLHAGYYLPADRYERLQHLIGQQDKWSPEELKMLMLDHRNPEYDTLCQILLRDVEESSYPEVVKILKNWNGTHEKSELAPGIFYQWLRKLMYNSCADEFGEEMYALWLKNHMFKRSYRMFLLAEDNPWWDNIQTAKKESREEVIRQSLAEAVEEIKAELGTDIQSWTWDRFHSAVHKHPIGQVPWLSSYFNVGPFAQNGGNESPLNQLIHLDSSFHLEVFGGAAVRRVIDMAHPDSSWNVLPSGQSGNPISKHYRDQAELYYSGDLRPQWMNMEKAARNAGSRILHLKPSN